MRFKLTDELKTNIKLLREIRSDESASPAVRVQAMQALVKMMQTCDEIERAQGTEDRPTPGDILAKIRAKNGNPEPVNGTRHIDT